MSRRSRLIILNQFELVIFCVTSYTAKHSVLLIMGVAQIKRIDRNLSDANQSCFYLKNTINRLIVSLHLLAFELKYSRS